MIPISITPPPPQIESKMGVSPSKRVSQTLSNSPSFTPCCDTVFTNSLSLAQSAFPGIKPYQLLSATQSLHSLLLPSLPLLSKWVPSPPDHSQVDRAYQTIHPRLRSNPVREDAVLDRQEFRMFAEELFSEAVVSRARGECLKIGGVGVVGIGGVGVVVKAGGGVVAAAIGTYALAVATTVYIGLGV